MFASVMHQKFKVSRRQAAMTFRWSLHAAAAAGKLPLLWQRILVKKEID